MAIGTRQILVLAFLFILVVIPNSIREITVPLFLFVGFGAILSGINHLDGRAIVVYACNAIVSGFYILVGSTSTTPEAIYLLIFVYIVSPLLWMYLCSYLLATIPITQLVNILIVYGFIACCTVVLFIQIFLGSGADGLLWIISVPNLQVVDGRIAATMHVYGSLIFLSAAFFAFPSVVRSHTLRIIFSVAFIVAALVSGRGALVFALLVGFAMNLASWNPRELVRLVLFILSALIVVGLVHFLGEVLSELLFGGVTIDTYAVFNDLWEKIVEGGGDERMDQFSALLGQAFDNHFIGAGHGVSAEFIRNDEQPWKYENLGAASLFHVGLIGTIVYSSPAILVLIAYRKLKRSKLANGVDRFMFTGLVSISIATMTNPYLESFDFHWMWILPSVYFLKRYLRISTPAPQQNGQAMFTGDPRKTALL